MKELDLEGKVGEVGDGRRQAGGRGAADRLSD